MIPANRQHAKTRAAGQPGSVRDDKSQPDISELPDLAVLRCALRPAHNLKADTFTASILRTHSQCQRGSVTASVPSLHTTDYVSSSLGMWRVVEPIGIEPMT